MTPTLVVDDGYSIASDGTEPESATDRELIIASPLNFTTFEQGFVNSYSEYVLDTEDVQTFTVQGDASLNQLGATYTVVSLVVNGEFDLLPTTSRSLATPRWRSGLSSTASASARASSLGRPTRSTRTTPRSRSSVMPTPPSR